MSRVKPLVQVGAIGGAQIAQLKDAFHKSMELSFLYGSNAGKSYMLQALALDAVKQGKQVLVVESIPVEFQLKGLFNGAHEKVIEAKHEYTWDKHTKGHHEYTPVEAKNEPATQPKRYAIPASAPLQTTWQKHVFHHWELMSNGAAYAVYGHEHGPRRRLKPHDRLSLLEALKLGHALEYTPK